MDFIRTFYGSCFFLQQELLQVLNLILLNQVILYQKYAKEKNTSVEKIVELNRIENPDLIKVGQILELDEEKNSEVSTETTTEEAVTYEDVTYNAPAASTTYSQPATAST